MAVAHYLEALDWQREFIKMHAVLGGKNPHLQSFLVGGMATPVDPDSQAALNTHTIAQLKSFIAAARDFVSKVYIPDLLAIASFYKDWAGHGRGVGNYLVFGDYPEDGTPQAPLFIPQGIIRGRDLSKVEPFDQTKVAEYITHSWYSYQQGDDASLHPLKGETSPNFTGPNPPFKQLDTDHEVLVAEVTALRRRADGSRSARAHAGVVRVGPPAGEGAGRRGAEEARRRTRGACSRRSAASPRAASKRRCSPTRWATGSTALAANMDAGDHRIHDNSKWDPSSWPADAVGFGLHEAPRGALSHWVNIHNGSDRQLPVRRAEHLERRPARREGPPRPVRRGAARTPVADAETADRDPPHRALVRSVHGVRRPRRRRARTRDHAR